MGNIDGFMVDYMEYRYEKFSNRETTNGIAAILTAGCGITLGVWGLIKLGILVATLAGSVIPFLNTILIPSGLVITPALIKHGIMVLAKDNSWNQLDKPTRRTIIAGVIFFQNIMTFSFIDKP